MTVLHRPHTNGDGKSRSAESSAQIKNVCNGGVRRNNLAGSPWITLMRRGAAALGWKDQQYASGVCGYHEVDMCRHVDGVHYVYVSGMRRVGVNQN